MSLSDDVARYYAARAPWYDETAGYLDPEAERLREPIKERYRKRFEGHRVLEIACGTGYWTAAVGETAHSILAIDADPALVSMTRERCGHLANVEVCIADAYALEGIPGGFSAAFARVDCVNRCGAGGCLRHPLLDRISDRAQRLISPRKGFVHLRLSQQFAILPTYPERHQGATDRVHMALACCVTSSVRPPP
ncbi:class I SAM-dependent methyltransferase [Candidatus Fermentibacteria bacterium]|nr:class I SAM-dependent methyltransferase [Candidatus Fermentibacteria bacterium]